MISKRTNITSRPGLAFIFHIVDNSLGQRVEMLAGLIPHFGKCCITVTLVGPAVVYQVPGVAFDHLFSEDLVFAVSVQHLGIANVYCEKVEIFLCVISCCRTDS